MATITADDIPVVNDFFTGLATTLTTYVNGTSTNIVEAIAPAAQILAVLLITMYGLLLMRGQIQAPLMDAAYKAIIFITLLGLALNVGLYQDSIVWFFMNAPSAMASVITDNGGGSVSTEGGNAVTNYLVAAYNLGDRVWQEAGITEVGKQILAGLIYALGTIVGAYAAFLFALASIVTGILLAIGPVFILCAMFESSRRFVEMWLQQVLNFGLIAVLTAAVLQFFIDRITLVANAALSKDAGDPLVTSDLMNFAIVSVLGVLVLRQVMPIASGLAGGMALATQGAFGAASGALGRAMGTTAKRFTPTNMAERYRQNQRNGATLRRMGQDFKASPMRTLARLHGGAVGGAAANAYKRKHQPSNSVSNAA